jgi:hypothetical protein
VYFAGGELRDIVGFEQAPVLFGVLLRHQKGFPSPSILIDIGEIQA